MAEPRQEMLLRFEQLVEGVAAFLTGLSAALIFLGVVLRNVFELSPSWVVEAPIYTFVWAVFLVLGGTFQRGVHLGLDIVVATLPAPLQRGFAVFCALAMVAIAATLVWLGLGLTLEQISIGAVSNTALKMPLYVVTAAMPLGFALLLVRALADIVGFWRREEDKLVPPKTGL